MCWLCLAAAPLALPAAPVDFAHDVVPVLKKHCIECHGGKESKGGFSVNTRELILEADAAVVGQPAASRLVELLESKDTEDQMPPKDRPRLAAKDIDVLRSWIEQGMKWESGFSFAERRYEPPLLPRRPDLPMAQDGRLNPVDRIVDAYLTQHKLPRPAPSSDAAFLRRISADLVGMLPEPDALSEFLADTSELKRERMVQELLRQDVAFAEHWLTFWNDLLRNDYTGTGFITGGRKQITSWLYRSLVQNKPYDQMVRELVAPSDQSEGFVMGIRWRGNVNASQTQEIQFAQNVGQAFLGINLKCASCHDSFIDRWTLQETYGLAQVYANQTLILHRCDKSTDKPAQAAWLFPQLGQIDAAAPQPERLRQLAALLTHRDNGRFTRTIVNRIWQRLMGRGIVHPVDAMHTEPWSADLLDFLAVDLVDHGYNLKRTMELICASQVYQAQSPAFDLANQGDNLFRGPSARRMTAEQFLDAVWQITGAAPARQDAAVLRVKLGQVPATAKTESSSARWIWTEPTAAQRAKTGETMTARQQFDLRKLPTRAVAAITCDNEYKLFVNGVLVQSDSEWETVEIVDLLPQLKENRNEIVVVAKNGGDMPNPAGLIFEARIQQSDNTEEVIVTDANWKWTAVEPNARGRFAKEPDWQAVSELNNPGVWQTKIEPQWGQLLASAVGQPNPMVRASLMKNNAFMTALGRPTRDQIVSMRPSELTTLEAIDLANGQVLADAIAQGAPRVLERQKDATGLIRWLFDFALSRPPTADEERLAVQLLGPQPEEHAVEDLLWSVFMLPEFQLIR